MFNPKTQRYLMFLIASFSVLVFTSGEILANENVVGRPKSGAVMTETDIKGALAPDRTIRKITKLTDKIRSTLGLPNTDFPPEGYGTDKSHPFTTKRVRSEAGISPVNEYPWRATGKLFMKFGNSSYVCTASVLRKGLLVTAAHCVHNYGKGTNGFADFVTFEPARDENSKPFGTWTAKEWWISKAYHDGTDVCTVPGVVCENDIAVVVLEKKNDQAIADLTGMYDFNDNEFYSYPEFLGERAGQITQLGYPSKNYDGDKMIRTDSLGYHDEPSNVIIGSNQTGGSSGGPWLMNFGIETTSFGGTEPTDNESNQVVGTTSWGYTTDRHKIQGASRFRKNSIYTIKSNIRSLVDEACAGNPDSC